MEKKALGLSSGVDVRITEVIILMKQPKFEIAMLIEEGHSFSWALIPVNADSDMTKPMLEHILKVLRKHDPDYEFYACETWEHLLEKILLGLSVNWETIPDPGLCQRRRN